MKKSDCFKPLVADRKRVAKTHQKAMEDMKTLAAKALSLSEVYEKRNLVCKACEDMSTFRTNARAGSTVIVTKPMAEITQACALEILEYDFARSLEETMCLLSKARAAEQFFKAIIEMGMLPERTPHWSEAKEKAVSVQPVLSSKVSVNSLLPSLQKVTIEDIFTDPDKSTKLLNLLGTAVATTPADQLLILGQDSERILQEGIQYCMDANGVVDAVVVGLPLFDTLLHGTQDTNKQTFSKGMEIVRLMKDVTPVLRGHQVKQVPERVLDDVNGTTLGLLYGAQQRMHQEVLMGLPAFNLASLSNFVLELKEITDQDIARRMGNFEIQVNEVMAEGYNINAVDSKPLGAVIGGVDFGKIWTENLQGADGFKEVKKEATKTLMNLNTAEFSMAMSRLTKLGIQVGTVSVETTQVVDSYLLTFNQ